MAISTRLKRLFYLLTLIFLITQPGWSNPPQVELILSASPASNITLNTPFEVEIRANLGVPLAAIDFCLSVTGVSNLELVERSADPAASNGLLYISQTSQQPFESGLPQTIPAVAATPEVLLGMNPFPYDNIDPGSAVLLETLTLKADAVGEVTLSLSNIHAASTLWIKDGTRLESIGTEPVNLSISIQDKIPGDLDTDFDIDVDDLLLLEWCSRNPYEASNSLFVDADIDSSAMINFKDLFLFSSQFSSQAESLKLQNKSQEFSLSGVRNDWALQDLKAIATVNADANGDYKVDHQDLTHVRQRLGLDPAEFENQSSDVNEDGAIDLVDLIAIRNRLRDTENILSNLVLNEVMVDSATGPWLEMKYIGTRLFTVNSNYQIHNSTGSIAVIQDAQLGPDMLLQIVLGESKPLEYIGSPARAIRMYLPYTGNPFDLNNDQCTILRHNSYTDEETVLDFVSWGSGGDHGRNVDVESRPVPAGGSIGRDAYENELWVRFEHPTPAAENTVAPPAPYIPISGGLVYSLTTTPFVWRDFRDAPLAYRLQVWEKGNSSAIEVDRLVAGLQYDVSPALEAGRYEWKVRSEAGEFVSPWSATAVFEVEEFPTELLSIISGKPRPSSGQASSKLLTDFISKNLVPYPHKDSRWICLECRQDSGAHAWDAPHQTSSGLCLHDAYYGMCAGIVSMVKYYGGNVLQDEVAYYAYSSKSGNLLEGALGHGKIMLPSDAFNILNDFLGGSAASDQTVTPSGGQLVWDILKAKLDGGNPMLILELEMQGQGGTWVGQPIIGYQEKQVQGNTIRRLIALDPSLKTNFKIVPYAWDKIKSARLAIPNDSGISARNTSESEWNKDSDNDGMADLDEKLRFNTLENHQDSDGDSIPDKKEVWSYTFGIGMTLRKADIDGDGYRAENDDDSDGDGCLDGAEDKNQNGNFIVFPKVKLPYVVPFPGRLKESGERDPFWQDKYDLDIFPQRTKVGVNSSVRIRVRLRDKDGGPANDQLIFLGVEPDTYGTLNNSVLLTDKTGWAETTFKANQQKGTVKLKATSDVCRHSASDPKWEKEKQLEITGLDWIFVRQEEARLTGREDLQDFGVMQGGEHYWYASRYKNKLYKQQTLKGTFFHPEDASPGLGIQEISLSRISDDLSLKINGNVVANSHWVRNTTNENPVAWEVILDTTKDLSQGYPFARYIDVKLKSDFAVRTPLVWWVGVHSQSRGTREYIYRISTSDYLVLEYENYQVAADFFFGDGDSHGQDTGDWPNVIHTSVGFIPTGTLTGAGLSCRIPSSKILDGTWWTDVNWANLSPGTSYAVQNYDAFGARKSDCYIMPPFSWYVFAVDTNDIVGYVQGALQGLAPFPPPAFFNDIRFKRDYIGDELAEIQGRNLTPPEFEIRMLSQ